MDAGRSWKNEPSSPWSPFGDAIMLLLFGCRAAGRPLLTRSWRALSLSHSHSLPLPLSLLSFLLAPPCSRLPLPLLRTLPGPCPSTTLPRPRSAILGPPGYRRACEIPERSLACCWRCRSATQWLCDKACFPSNPASRVLADAALHPPRYERSPWLNRWQANGALPLARSRIGELASSQLVVHGHSGAQYRR